MSRATILLVDDDEDMLAVLDRWCTQDGFDVLSARDGFEALARLRESPVDLVVTDLVMPHMSGLKLLEMLKAYDDTIQVVVLTGKGSMETAIEALREGKAFDFLLKPLPDLAVLSAALARALDRRRQMAAYRAQEGALATMSKPTLIGFSDRELEIARLLAQGLRQEQIQDRLALSHGTLKNHLTTIYSKLGARGRADAVVALLKYRLE